MNHATQKVEFTPSVNLNDNQKDYQVVRQVLEYLVTSWQRQPKMEELCRVTGIAPTKLQKTFVRWAGISPKDFLQAITLSHARKMLDDGLPLLETSYELGLSGPGRLHDLFVTHEAMSPGTYKAKGEGLTIEYGYHDSPFGTALVMITDRGLAGLAFADTNNSKGKFSREWAFEDMTKKLPNANYKKNQKATEPYTKKIFDSSQWSKKQPLRIILIGTDFEIKVWEGLLKIPMGNLTTYSGLSESIGYKKNAARAVGAAVGQNPISFVVPCHRVVGKSGALTGYRWGLTRKQAMLGWEAAKTMTEAG